METRSESTTARGTWNLGFGSNMGVEIVTEKKGVKILGKRFIPTYRVSGVVVYVHDHMCHPVYNMSSRAEAIFNFSNRSHPCHPEGLPPKLHIGRQRVRGACVRRRHRMSGLRGPRQRDPPRQRGRGQDGPARGRGICLREEGGRPGGVRRPETEGKHILLHAAAHFQGFRHTQNENICHLEE